MSLSFIHPTYRPQPRSPKLAAAASQCGKRGHEKTFSVPPCPFLTEFIPSYLLFYCLYFMCEGVLGACITNTPQAAFIFSEPSSCWNEYRSRLVTSPIGCALLSTMMRERRPSVRYNSYVLSALPCASNVYGAI